jgi:putative Mn2+ efflux pump MntP
MLAVLGIATSIDALAIGVSYAFIGYAMWVPVAVIGLRRLLGNDSPVPTRRMCLGP